MKPYLCLLFLFFNFISHAQFRLNVEGDAQVLGRLNLISAGTNNIFVGGQSGSFLTTGSENAFFGTRAGFLNTSGKANAFMGHEAGRNNVSGSENTALGRFALGNNQLNNKNIAIGSRALLDFVDGFGEDPLSGSQDLRTTYNLAIGTSAGQFTNDPTRSDGERNTFVGNNAGLFNTTGWRNAFFGFQAGDQNGTGWRNTCIGHEADLSANNLFNAGAFGSDAVVNASNKIRIGDGAISTVEGNGWSLPSDGRFKTNVQEDVPGLDFLMALRPVTYQFDVLKYNAHVAPDEGRAPKNDRKQQKKEENYRRASAVIQTGFIAQEVEAVAQEQGFDFNGLIKPTHPKDNYGLSYSLFVVPVIKGMQEQQAQIEALQEENSSLEATNKTLETRIANLEAIVERLVKGESGPTNPDQSMQINNVRLDQNRPNPFSKNTTISYYIPEKVQDAILEIIGLDGRILKSIQVTNRNEGSTQLETTFLSAGTYVYRLRLDGKTIASKQMLISQ